jgi:nicotinamidase-related amidase
VGRSESGLNKVLLVVDAQEVFLRINDWYIPSFSGIIENISALANFFGSSTVFSKHVPPATSAKGTWNDFYKHWNYIGSDPTIWEIATPLKGLRGTEFVKATYSCFGSPEFLKLICNTSRIVVSWRPCWMQSTWASR